VFVRAAEGSPCGGNLEEGLLSRTISVCSTARVEEGHEGSAIDLLPDEARFHRAPRTAGIGATPPLDHQT
jgi:hypothetical protein